MTKAKRKNQYTLPSRQLAKAFRFSAADLASNRAGFVTDAQRWNLPMFIRWLGWVGEDLSYSSKNRPIATRICGKIKIQQKLHEVHGGRFQVQWRRLTVEGRDESFSLSQEQASLLSDGLVYHLYYDSRNGNLLSLERATTGC